MKNLFLFVVSNLLLFILMSCLTKKNDTKLLPKVAHELDYSLSYFKDVYELYDTFYIFNLNTTNVTFKPKGTGYPFISCLIDDTNNNVFVGKANSWNGFENNYTHTVLYDFHDFKVYSHDFQYIENYLQKSKKLQRRLIQAAEMDSLFLYSAANHHSNKKRINNLIDLESIFDKWKLLINKSNKNDFVKKKYHEYLKNGYNFLSQRIINQSKTSFIYKVQNGRCLLLLELNHGSYDDSNNQIRYELNVYQVSLKNPNLDRLLGKQSKN